MYIPGMKLQKEMVAASSIPFIISILEGDNYGYAIIRQVRELSNGEIELSEGMLYPVLHWLVADGQIRGRWQKSKIGHERRYYSLEAKGKRALDEQRRQWGIVTATLSQLWENEQISLGRSQKALPCEICK
jgi:PadR family transcriptional regulator PadR